MTRSTAHPLSGSPATLRSEARPGADGRLAGLALMAGCVLATLGFLGVSLTMHGSETAWPTDSLWQPMYGVALAGNVLVVLGLPAILAVHGRAFRRLTLVGYLGIAATMVMLNVAETTIEAFVKPYLVTHGGLPQEQPGGLNAWVVVALVLGLVGTVCLAVAVFRARIVPIWVGIAVILSLVGALFLPSGPMAFIADYLLFAALFVFGLRAARPAVSA
jgi:hypothetical protein